MTVNDFRELVRSHYDAQKRNGIHNPFLSPGENFAFDLYRNIRDRKNAPLRVILGTVLHPTRTELSLDVVRSRIAALEIQGTCDPEILADWRNVESTLCALHELLIGKPEEQ